MTGIKSIMNRLGAFGKTAQTAFLSQGVHLLVSSGQYLVNITLMPNIPYDPV